MCTPPLQCVVWTSSSIKRLQQEQQQRSTTTTSPCFTLKRAAATSMSYKQQDYFTLELQTPIGQPLPFIESDGARCFVGEPGQEFIVSVNATVNSGMTYQLSLKVDGEGPGYNKILHGHVTNNSTVWKGWLVNSGPPMGEHGTDSCDIYKMFKFGTCKPSAGAATVSNPDDIQAGKIEVQVTQVVDTGRRKALTPVQPAEPSRAANSKKLSEGKKWFLAPGLKAEAGSAVAQTTNWSPVEWRAVRSLPDLKLRYDSSEALYLRKALNPRFAPHRAILRKSANPAIAALGAEPAAAAGAAAAAGGGSSRQQDAIARVKREAAGVKRERDDADDDEYVPRSATAQDRVDLTEEPVRPMTVNGRQLAPDELAVCDLCDSDDEAAAAAPRWQVKKKQQIEVTEM